MRDIVNTYVRKFKEERRERRRLLGALAVLAVLVTTGIMWQFRSEGIAMTNQTFCGKEEHIHDNSCYAWVLKDGSDETSTEISDTEGTGADSSMEISDTEGTGTGSSAEISAADTAVNAETEDVTDTTANTETEGTADTLVDTTADTETETAADTEEVSALDSAAAEVATAESEEAIDEAAADTAAEPEETSDDTAATKAEVLAAMIDAAGTATEKISASDSASETDTTASASETESTDLPEMVLFTEATESEEWYLAHGYEKVLVCGEEEHTHTIECMSDETADVETAEDWEAALPTLSGIQANDVVSVALSQVGYTESTKNYILADDGETLLGYTRYGTWYGESFEYVNWNAMFAAFCLRYAGVSAEDFPVNSGAYAWMADLTAAGLYEDAAEYTPQAGDLVFFDTDEDGKADRVGILTAVPAETDESGEIVTLLIVVEGDYSEGDVDIVAENQYALGDSSILGYGTLPEQEITYPLTLIYEGTDYILIVTCGEDTQLTEDVCLVVTEYEEDSETWLARYAKAAAFYDWKAEISEAESLDAQSAEGENTQETVNTEETTADAENADTENETVSDGSGLWAFDIRFETDGEEVVPAAAVTMTITFPQEETGDYAVLSVADEETEALEIETSFADTTQTISFVTETVGEYALISDPEANQEDIPVTLTCEGEDYIVTVTYTRAAKLPENTGLSVSEYDETSETWQTRYAEAAALYGWGEEEKYDFRLFNIALLSDGAEVEPAAEVQVTISFTDKEELTEYTVTHYGTEETETMDAVSDYEEGTQSVSFGTNGFTDYGLSASPANPTFTVQYYAWLDVVNTSNSGTLTLIDTSASGNNSTSAVLPQNGTTPQTIGVNLNSDGTVATTSTLTKVYKDAEYEYSKAPDLEHFNKLIDNAGYILKEIWVLKDGADVNNATDSDWTVYSDNPASIEFTNTATEASGIKIYVGEGTVIRLIYDTASSSYINKANFYDYDISDGSKTQKDGYTLTNTIQQGINSLANYSGTGTMLAFGNSNTGTGLGTLSWNGAMLNEFNGKSYGSTREGFEGCTFGLVNTLLNGVIQYSAGVDAPNLFDDGDAIGKTTYSNQNLIFSKNGDTYTLTAVSGEANVSGLDKFTNPGGYTSIFTNNFWPMDTVDSYASDGHDMAFGDKTKVSQRRYGNGGIFETFPKSDDGEDHNSYFGMQYSVDFTLDGEYAGPLNYYFFGDDDMWVFLTKPDGTSVLVCDIGGVHSSVGEYVDLWDYIDENATGTYTLSFFYTERGASGSTCYMQFTLPSVTSATTVQDTGSLRVEKEVDSDEATGNETFNFTLDLKDSSGNALTDTYGYVIHNSDGSQHATGTVTNGSEFSLSDGQYIIVSYLPAGTQCTVTETTTGYITYYTVDSGTLTEGTSASGSIANGNTLAMKFVNSTPNVEKKVQDSSGSWVDENTASTGSNVQFKTTISDVSSVTNLVLHDVLDSGLADPSVTGVMILDSSGGETSVDTAYYMVTYYVGENATSGATRTDKCTSECSFDIKFEDSFLASLDVGDSIVVCYRARLTDEAKIGTTEGNENTTRISYGTSSYSEWDTTITYTFEIDILKYSGDEKLSGAEFILYYFEEITSTEPSGGTPTTTVKKYAQVDTSGYLTGWTSDDANATTLTSDGNGKISAKGLAPGTYYLQETKAPDGYTLLSDPIEITVSSTGTITYKIDGAEYSASATENLVKVANTPGAKLPETGGPGTYLYTLAGLLLLGAACLMYKNLRRKGDLPF